MIIMGKRGAIRQPAHVAKAKGTYRPARYANDLPVEPALPSVPPWLDDDRALKHWKRIGPLLVDQRLLSALDTDSFAMLCKTLAELEECNELIAKTGLIVYSEKGTAYQNPAVGLRNRLRAEFKGWAREFGMTYSARIGLGSGDKEPEADPIQEMMARIMGTG